MTESTEHSRGEALLGCLHEAWEKAAVLCECSATPDF